MSQDQERILKNLPPSVTRIKVCDMYGATVWKKVAEVLPSDEIIFNTSGYPITMVGTPGRKSLTDGVDVVSVTPPTPTPAPTTTLAKSALMLCTEKNPESPDVLNQVMVELASEASALAQDRIEAERRGLDTSAITGKRLVALKSIADTWIKRKNQGTSSMIDLESEAFRALFKFILSTFRDSMIQCGTRPEVIETVFANFSSRLNDDWMNEARGHMKNVIVE